MCFWQCEKHLTYNIEEISLELVDILTRNNKTEKQMKLYFLTIFLRVFNLQNLSFNAQDKFLKKGQKNQPSLHTFSTIPTPSPFLASRFLN